MRTTIKLLILILIFGCKNQNQPNDKTISKKTQSKIQQIDTSKSVFPFIINKKESPKDFPNNITQKFDLTERFTKREISHLNLDTTKIGINEYYFLTNQKFLKKPIDSISFLIYFKYLYGYGVKKVLRIKNKDKSTDIILAMRGGDGQDSYLLSSKFLNDSVFVQTSKHKQTAIDNTHLMAYVIDSIVTKFKYDKKFHFKEIKQDSFYIYRKYPIYHKNLKGKIFKTWSSHFKINDIQCKWEYEVKYTDETDKNSEVILVNLVSQNLINIKTGKSILNLDLSLFPYLHPLNLYDLKFYDFKPQDFDINFDGYNDFQFYDRAIGGANHVYYVYLFKPDLKRFEFSKKLTGGSMANGIILDKEKRTAKYSGKSGGGLYGFRIISFDKKGKIKFEERYWNNDVKDENHTKFSFNYEKSKNGIVIDSLKVVKKLETVTLQSIYNSFSDWMDSLKVNH